MCGIVGILGNKEVSPYLLEVLKRLEYRGYDSAGIATIDNGVLVRRRAVGKLINLSELLVSNPISGRSGIGHTRWATHGNISVDNAHPHVSGQVAIVHNGIIENYQKIKDDLMSRGRKFTSQTDSEVIAHLFDEEFSKNISKKNATQNVIKNLEGAFAFVVLDLNHDVLNMYFEILLV